MIGAGGVILGWLCVGGLALQIPPHGHWQVCSIPPHQEADGHVHLDNGKTCAEPKSLADVLGIGFCDFKKEQK